MPQMAPLSWLTLMLLFLGLYLLNTIKVYFTSTYSLQQTSALDQPGKKIFAWKW